MPAPTSEVEPEPVMEATASAPVATTPVEDAPEVEAGAPSTPAESPEPQQEVADAEGGETPPTRPAGWRRNPLQFQSVRAPRVGLRAPVSPLSGPNDLTIMDALARPTEFAAPEFGFEMPDWQEPFRDIQADVMNQNLTSDDLNLEGNVKLRMGDMLFESDAFEYREGDGLISADGNVKVSQMQSTITASGFDYYLRAPEELPPPTLLDANPSEQERAKQRLTLGRIDAENIHIMEPTRELIAESIEYDMLTSQGELINARGKAGIYYFFAERLVVTGPSSFYGEEVWITTCECSEDDPPPYRLRMRNVEIVDGELIGANHARLQIKNFNTPLYFPVWRRGGNKVYPWTVDFDSGRRAEVGYFLNVAQQYQVTPDLYIGPRIYPTEKEGVGFGIDVDYDFMETPSSRLFRSKGSIESLYTTKDRGYVHAYHRYQHSQDLVLRMQAEYWGDEAFYRDFYYDKYRNRTSPRTFANVTYRRPGYIATGTARVNPHSWVRETERLPEGTFHLLERSLGGGFYLTYDNVTGYNEREPRGPHGTRTINLARLTYDLDLAPAFSITPFAEVEASWYSDQRDSDASETRLATNFGVTAQTRFHRVYPGRFGFSAIKHLVVPSITYSYRPKTNIDVTEAPIFDSWDNVAGQSRLETKLDNIFYGKDAETGETWQLGRISFYQGNDFWNEQRKTEDYEIEVDIRPRPWWGFQLVGERHVVQNDLDINDPGFLETWLAERLDRWFDYRPDNEFFDFNAQYGDYNRVLTQLYYDNTPLGGRWSTRLGFAYTETQSRVFNREFVYGAGYRISDRWSVGFEHRYDFEDDTLRTQQYEVRRIWDCWESAIRFRDRESGFDVDVEFSISAFPGTRLKL
jgi:lipopolysaccharide assembly outer membrane protein LptD (OstA)